MNPPSYFARVLGALWLAAGLAGCGNMQHQDNVRSFEASTHFADGASARHPPAHTVARDAPAPDDPVATGRKAGVLLTELPLPLTRDLLQRGRERFNAFCAPCHGEDGYGRGIVVRRGFPAPASFHEAGMRAAAAGHLFAVITRGSGRMYPLADRIDPRDRWAVVAYVRALQRSQHATAADLTAEERQRLPTE
jgi:mono/diheme cytochrome c family protein